CYLRMSESRARRGLRDVSNPYVVPTAAKNTISAYKILEFNTKSFDRSLTAYLDDSVSLEA
ncbi:MAG TPA: hypothetical protein VGQ39_26425, partial [Pyrinomonadaceae bacterium]|nr:hypothetical protein [Pyrinomonadaceae bacterium]